MRIVINNSKIRCYPPWCDRVSVEKPPGLGENVITVLSSWTECCRGVFVQCPASELRWLNSLWLPGPAAWPGVSVPGRTHGCHPGWAQLLWKFQSLARMGSVNAKCFSSFVRHMIFEGGGAPSMANGKCPEVPLVLVELAANPLPPLLTCIGCFLFLCN